MSDRSTARLVTGQRIPHQATTISFTTTAAEYEAPATAAGARFCFVYADDGTLCISSLSGEEGGTATTANTGHDRAYAGSFHVIQFPDPPTSTRKRPKISVRGLSATVTGAIVWVL